MASIDPPIIDDPAAVTPEWMTAVLRHAGHDVRVRALRREAVGTGQMAHNERFFLESEGAPEDAPRTVVIKFPSPNEESRASGARGGYRSEVLFYTELLEGLRIRTPKCHYGAVSDDSSVFTLVLEDMAPAQQGDQIEGATPDQIEAAVRNLAGLHAPRCGDPALEEIAWLSHDWSAEAGQVVKLVTPLFVERFGGRLSASAVSVLHGFAEGAQRWLETAPGPRVLVHGDYRLDNLLFEDAEDGVRVAAVDWQTLTIGSGGQDLAYLLGNSFEPDARRREEARMLTAYREALAANAVERSDTEILAAYRHGSFQGPFITMLGAMGVGRTERGDAMFIAMAERSAAQILDHDALSLIG